MTEPATTATLTKSQSLPLALLRHYPATALLLAPYAVLIVPMAVINHNPETGFILRLLALAMAGATTVETAALLIWGRKTWRKGAISTRTDHPHIFLIARLVAIVSMIADVVGTTAGRGTIVTQVTGKVAASPVAGASALVAGWSYVAFALLLFSFLSGRARPGAFYRWTLALIGVQVYLVFLTARSAPLIGYLTFVFAAGLILGAIRFRYVVVATALLFLVWPTIFTARNEVRVANGIAVSDKSATDRLRFDTQVTRASGIDVPVDVGQPGIADLPRYGLVPRILDPERPLISTGAKINQYFGGSATSSFTFLTLGTVYFLDGPIAVIVYCGLWALVVASLLSVGRGPGPIRLCLLCLVIAGPLVWISTYPDTVIGLLQYTVSASPVFLAIMLSKREKSTEQHRAPALDPHLALRV
ncbi:hypothetical protein [Micromonospora sp. NPDC005806]|uniref:hypothetical protein n=1 Tax=Micromonospora sp. NPDC005806 TaxID=3364234 RepID=UPI0036D03F31